MRLYTTSAAHVTTSGGARPPADYSTDALPGSPHYRDVLRDRETAGTELYHPDDVRLLAKLEEWGTREHPCCYLGEFTDGRRTWLAVVTCWQPALVEVGRHRTDDEKALAADPGHKAAEAARKRAARARRRQEKAEVDDGPG